MNTRTDMKIRIDDELHREIREAGEHASRVLGRRVSMQEVIESLLNRSRRRVLGDYSLALKDSLTEKIAEIAAP
jgi:hypothetical protein